MDEEALGQPPSQSPNSPPPSERPPRRKKCTATGGSSYIKSIADVIELTSTLLSAGTPPEPGLVDRSSIQPRPIQIQQEQSENAFVSFQPGRVLGRAPTQLVLDGSQFSPSREVRHGLNDLQQVEVTHSPEHQARINALEKQEKKTVTFDGGNTEDSQLKVLNKIEGLRDKGAGKNRIWTTTRQLGTKKYTYRCDWPECGHEDSTAQKARQHFVSRHVEGAGWVCPYPECGHKHPHKRLDDLKTHHMVPRHGVKYCRGRERWTVKGVADPSHSYNTRSRGSRESTGSQNGDQDAGQSNSRPGRPTRTRPQRPPAFVPYRKREKERSRPDRKTAPRDELMDMPSPRTEPYTPSQLAYPGGAYAISALPPSEINKRSSTSNPIDVGGPYQPRTESYSPTMGFNGTTDQEPFTLHPGHYASLSQTPYETGGSILTTGTSLSSHYGPVATQQPRSRNSGQGPDSPAHLGNMLPMERAQRDQVFGSQRLEPVDEAPQINGTFPSIYEAEGGQNAANRQYAFMNPNPPNYVPQTTSPSHSNYVQAQGHTVYGRDNGSQYTLPTAPAAMSLISSPHFPTGNDLSQPLQTHPPPSGLPYPETQYDYLQPSTSYAPLRQGYPPYVPNSDGISGESYQMPSLSQAMPQASTSPSRAAYDQPQHSERHFHPFRDEFDDTDGRRHEDETPQ